MKSNRVCVGGLEDMIDLEQFRSSLKEHCEHLEDESKGNETIKRFLKACEHKDEHGDW